MARKKKKQSSRKTKLILPLLIVFLLLFSLAGTVYFVFLSPGTIPEHPPIVADKHGDKPDIIYEEPITEPELHLIQPDSIKKRMLSKEHAMVSIVIDDMGYIKSTGSELLDLDLPLSFAFLPFGPFTDFLIAKARHNKKDILLHLPMEALDSKWDPGPGALYTSMSKEEIQKNILLSIDSIGPIVGVNNHMGSRFTSDRFAMQACLSLLAEKNLFFLDSLTTPNSIGYSLAKDMNVKTARRTLFLDNRQDKEAIIKQLESLVQIARKHGHAIALGHPHQATLEALKEYRQKLQEQVTVVAVHRLVE